MGEAERILFNQVFRSRLFYGCRYIDMVQGVRCAHINADLEPVVTFTKKPARLYQLIRFHSDTTRHTNMKTSNRAKTEHKTR